MHTRTCLHNYLTEQTNNDAKNLRRANFQTGASLPFAERKPREESLFSLSTRKTAQNSTRAWERWRAKAWGYGDRPKIKALNGPRWRRPPFGVSDVREYPPPPPSLSKRGSLDGTRLFFWHRMGKGAPIHIPIYHEYYSITELGPSILCEWYTEVLSVFSAMASLSIRMVL